MKAWSALTDEERRVFARYYEAFAACMEAADRELGRVIGWMEGAGILRDTLVLVLSDNGASPEGGPEGIWNELRLFTANKPGEFAGGAERINDIGQSMSALNAFAEFLNNFAAFADFFNVDAFCC